MKRHTPLLVILLLYMLIGTLFAINTPPWQAPDEPAHYNYVRQLAAGEWPVIEAGDYDQEYLVEVVFSSHFAPQYSIEPFEYEDYQPPLYYLLQTPVFWIFQGALLPMRLLSVLLGAGVVSLAYAIAGRVFPGRPWLALTSTAFVAFLPQHVAMLAAVNNDSLAELIIAGILWILLADDSGKWQVASGRWQVAGGNPKSKIQNAKWLGLLLGLGFLTKATVYIMAPVILLVIWRPYPFRRSSFILHLSSLLVFLPAVLLGALWWGRNLVVYGGLDVLGLAAHNAVVTGQPRTAEWIAERGFVPTLSAFATTTFHSFWGQFGWMTVPMPDWVYRPLLLFSLLSISGLMWAVIQRRRMRGERRTTADNPPPSSVLRPPSSLILVTTFLLNLLLYFYYNLTFVQHQGRYLFPALIPISLGVAAGLEGWLRPVVGRWPVIGYALPAGLTLALTGLDLLALLCFIIPSLS